MPDIKNIQTENKAEKIISPDKTTEKIKPPEKSIENDDEIRREKETVLEEIEKFSSASSAGQSKSSIIVHDEDNKRMQKIEAIMEEELEEIYLKMPPDKQREFKIAGEKTVKEINSLLKEIKLNVKKIVNLIIKWLLIIPGINKFYAEQEAKIKTDELLKLKEI